MTATDYPVTIAAKRSLTDHIVEFTLLPLPTAAPRVASATPGSHVNVLTPSGETRSYSVVRVNRDGSITIAVKREATGRGGSKSLVDDTAVGTELMISATRNSFELHPANEYVFIAGGIGITGISALFDAALAVPGTRATLVYLSSSPEEAAYFTELTEGEHRDKVITHHRSLADGRPFDFWPLLADPRDGERRVYCCGPESLNDSIRALTMHWRPSTVHFESFAGVSAFGALSEPFQVRWEPTGAIIDVAADETMLAALNRSGIPADSSCESGTCGTCRLSLLAGTAEHRDAVLGDRERATAVMPCVSRAAAGPLVLAPPA